MTLVRGVDGCREGWISVTSDLSSGQYSWSLASSLRELADAEPRSEVIAVDVPIGLPDSGSRECDIAARRLLGPGRASSVFPAPIQRVLDSKTHAEASAVREAAEGKRISIQAWAIIPKIREVDLALRSDPSLRSGVREVHPEVCFFYMAWGRAMQHAKKGRGCSTDDLLDALAAIWTAGRIVNGVAVTVPANPGHDRFGLPMEMVA